MGGGACVRSGCLSPLCGAAVGQRAPLCRSPQLAAGSELWPSLSGPIVLPGLCPVGLQGCGSFLVLPVPGAGGGGRGQHHLFQVLLNGPRLCFTNHSSASPFRRALSAGTWQRTDPRGHAGPAVPAQAQWVPSPPRHKAWPAGRRRDGRNGILTVCVVLCKRGGQQHQPHRLPPRH